MTEVSSPPTNSINPVPKIVRTPSTSYHDTGDERAGVVGVVIADRKPDHMGVDLGPQFGNEPLRGLRKRLDQNE